MSVKNRAAPINKRYPGEHTVRCRIWFPGGSWVEYEGPISAAVARDVGLAITNSKRDAPVARKAKSK